MLTASPNPLVAVWLGECAKFFHPNDLVAREFTDVDDWLKNTQPGVVWIVKINTLSSESSFFRLCAVQGPDIRLLSTWLDQGHISSRASDGSDNTGSRRHDTMILDGGEEVVLTYLLHISQGCGVTETWDSWYNLTPYINTSLVPESQH
jgi:hypothetical protein